MKLYDVERFKIGIEPVTKKTASEMHVAPQLSKSKFMFGNFIEQMSKWTELTLTHSICRALSFSRATLIVTRAHNLN